MLVLLGLPIWWIIRQGTAMDLNVVAHSVDRSPLRIFSHSLAENFGHPLSLLLLQTIAILIAVRIFSYLCKLIGQPSVIGEIVAGIVLGPSLLGYFFPEIYRFLFSPGSLEPLHILSQIGLVLFMFVIGMELDLSILKKKASQTLVISHASIIVPFLLGVALAYFYYPEFGAGHTSFLPFSLFIGISISITAFPVLARIIQERNLTKTPMGMLAIASAANNDITAWCLLAAIIAIAEAGSMVSALFTIGAACLFIFIMFTVVRPLLRKMGEYYNNQEVMNKTFISTIFMVLILSSYVTEVLGIHALFGAFLAGVIMPENVQFRRVMTEKVEDVALVLFLPLFFVFTGLRTEIGLLNTPHLWGICLIFILVSIAGKLIGAAFSARFVGENWKDSLSIGILMNTRGLMELIVLNIGFELGIIPSPIFVIFVIMALTTTFMATPCLVLIEKIFRRKKRVATHHPIYSPRILMSFGHPDSGAGYIRLLAFLFGRHLGDARITAVHYTVGTDTSPIEATEYEEESFRPVREAARERNIRVKTVYQVTDNYLKSLRELADSEQADFVLVGGGPRFIEEFTHRNRYLIFNSGIRRIGNLIHTRLWNLSDGWYKNKKRFLSHVEHTTGIFVDRRFDGARNVGIILQSVRESGILNFCETIGPDARIDVRIPRHDTLKEVTGQLNQARERHGDRITVSSPGLPLQQYLEGKELLILSAGSWVEIVENYGGLIARLPSFLIIKTPEEEKKEE